MAVGPAMTSFTVMRDRILSSAVGGKIRCMAVIRPLAAARRTIRIVIIGDVATIVNGQYVGDDNAALPTGTMAQDHADLIYGDVGNDTIYGDFGNDTIYGLQGSDTIDGGWQADTIYAGINESGGGSTSSGAIAGATNSGPCLLISGISDLLGATQVPQKYKYTASPL